jgi:hypothetical protein
VKHELGHRAPADPGLPLAALHPDDPTGPITGEVGDLFREAGLTDPGLSEHDRPSPLPYPDSLP